MEKICKESLTKLKNLCQGVIMQRVELLCNLKYAMYFIAHIIATQNHRETIQRVRLLDYDVTAQVHGVNMQRISRNKYQ